MATFTDELDEAQLTALVPSFPSPALAAFEAVRDSWCELGGHAAHFFQTPEWIERLAGHQHGDVRWVVARAGERPAGVALLQRSIRRTAGMNLRVLARAPFGEASLLYSDGLLDPELADGARLRQLLDGAGSWDMAKLQRLRDDSPWLQIAGGAIVRDEPIFGGVGVLDTAVPSVDACRLLPKNMRNALRKSRRKIDERGGMTITVATGREIATAFDQFVALEASGWKASEGYVLATMPMERELLRDFFQSSPAAQIRLMHVDGQLAAAQLAVTNGRRLYLMRIAYDESLSELSPSNVLLADLLDACCQDADIDRIDCMCWQTWHERWGMTREPTYELIAFNRRSARGHLARAIWHARERLAS